VSLKVAILELELEMDSFQIVTRAINSNRVPKYLCLHPTCLTFNLNRSFRHFQAIKLPVVKVSQNATAKTSATITDARAKRPESYAHWLPFIKFSTRKQTLYCLPLIVTNFCFSLWF
jgi:hypothetical protein